MINEIKQRLSNIVDNPDLYIIDLYIPGNALTNNANKKVIHVVQEGALLFGTKQRAVYKLLDRLKTLNTKEVLYVGGYNGFGPSALAYGAWKHNLKATICIAYKTTEKLNFFLQSKQRAALIALGANIILFKTFAKARDYANKLYNKNKKRYIYPAMGLTSPLLINILSSQILKVSKKIIINDTTTIWITTGSGGVAMALYQAFPQANFGIFMTGGERYKNNVLEWAKDKKNVVIIPDLLLGINAKVPYYTVRDYDDYIYSYVNQYGLDGDYIWNIAADEII